MELARREVGNVTVVRCKGRLIYGDESDNLRAVVKNLLNRHPWILLNLAEVSYVDSGGFGTLFGLRTSAQHAGGNLVLACATQRVLHLLHQTRLATVFDVFDNEEEAIRSFPFTAEAESSYQEDFWDKWY
jgi:anti-sigma B factor antagonist